MFKKRGFTLIEMMIVVAIIAILSGVILTGLNSARKQARDSRRMADIKNIQAQLEVYYNSANSYPSSLEAANPPIKPQVDSQKKPYVYCTDGQHYIVGSTNMETRKVTDNSDGCDTSNYPGDACCNCSNTSSWCISL